MASFGNLMAGISRAYSATSKGPFNILKTEIPTESLSSKPARVLKIWRFGFWGFNPAVPANPSTAVLGLKGCDFSCLSMLFAHHYSSVSLYFLQFCCPYLHQCQTWMLTKHSDIGARDTKWSVLKFFSIIFIFLTCHLRHDMYLLLGIHDGNSMEYFGIKFTNTTQVRLLYKSNKNGFIFSFSFRV